MPRRHRSARERSRPEPVRGPASVAPEWARTEGFTVRQVVNEKVYRCPGCEGVIAPGTPHVVVAPDGDQEVRRHWHSPCWRQEVRRRG